MGREMRGGSVRATPGANNCRFCKMAPICRKGTAQAEGDGN
ncbi:MAG: hypothetical protein J6X72_06890 [Clostridia bacterium]|nr:hypothetical protein [Clostridia bacterium]